MRSALKGEYSKNQVNCPFLIDNSCSIYAVRPVTCRTYFAYGNPERCKKEL
ncbi:YkgJ family cysteine cluster protein [Bacillus cereus]|uniref:YkgJ family cysteine cluster protein n=1 Tax=Bacillus cereus TaxID=1396 RepID=UPI003B284F1F